MAAKTMISALLILPALTAALNPSCNPGGNFDLRPWSLQLPTGEDGDPDTVSSAKLQNCDGYHDKNFYTDASNGQIVMLAPGLPEETHCATTSGSDHCRTEFREVDPNTGKNTDWDPSGTNTLTVGMTVIKADDGTHGTAIGQVFASDPKKPLAEMYYSQEGKIVVGVKTSDKGHQVPTTVGQVPLGTPFTYELSYSQGQLSVTINGNKTPLSTYDWDSPRCYFKAGNYNQAVSDVGSEVHIDSIQVVHN